MRRHAAALRRGLPGEPGRRGQRRHYGFPAPAILPMSHKNMSTWHVAAFISYCFTELFLLTVHTRVNKVRGPCNDSSTKQDLEHTIRKASADKRKPINQETQ
jgi:hypothetical protein